MVCPIIPVTSPALFSGALDVSVSASLSACTPDRSNCVQTLPEHLTSSAFDLISSCYYFFLLSSAVGAAREARPSLHGKAMFAQSNMRPCYFRYGYDIAVPLRARKLYPRLKDIPPLDRKYFATFKASTEKMPSLTISKGVWLF